MTAQQRYSQHTLINQYRPPPQEKWHVSKFPFTIWHSSAQIKRRFKILQVCTSVKVKANLHAQNCCLSSNNEATPPSEVPPSIISVQCLDLCFFSREGATRGGQAPPRMNDHRSSMKSMQPPELMLPKPQRGITESFTVRWTVPYTSCTNIIQRFVPKNMRDISSFIYVKCFVSYFNKHNNKCYGATLFNNTLSN